MDIGELSKKSYAKVGMHNDDGDKTSTECRKDSEPILVHIEARTDMGFNFTSF